MTKTKFTLKAIVLTGGKSVRMGEDKYLLTLNGDPQYVHLYKMLTSLRIDTFISCNNEQSKSISDAYPKIIDEQDSIGPIGGLFSAISHDSSCSWLIVACDLIHVNHLNIKLLCDSNDSNSEIVTFQKINSSFLETTLTIYNPTSFNCIKKAVEIQDYSLQNVLKKCCLKSIKIQDNKALTNANQPKDLK